jgi:hypothetical protein
MSIGRWRTIRIAGAGRDRLTVMERRASPLGGTGETPVAPPAKSGRSLPLPVFY